MDCARSTVSPHVQETADSLEGTDKIVLVKNPVTRCRSLVRGCGAIVYRQYQKTG